MTAGFRHIRPGTRKLILHNSRVNSKRSTSIDDYLDGVPSAEARAALERLRTIVREEVPDAQEAISYGMPAFKLSGPFVWFGAFKGHCSFFAGHTVGAFADRLSGFKTAKGTVRFTPDKPLPDDLIRDIVRARVGELRTR